VEIVDADVLVAYYAKAEFLGRARKLRWIQAGSAGIDHFFKLSDVDAEWLRSKGIMLVSASGLSRVVVAEQALVYMLMFVRGMPRAMRQQMQRHWEIFPANQMAGKTIGIIGLGGIGSRIAKLCKCLDTYVIGVDPKPRDYAGTVNEILPVSDVEEIFKRSDFLVLACPVTELTRNLVNARTLALMKSTGFLINVARGEIVDYDALATALKSGVIAGFGGDTFGPPSPDRTMKNLEELPTHSPLWDMDNVIITPNHAAATPRIYEYLADLFVENQILIEGGKQPHNRIA
jgi:phosphoglycerate dehydrogenase-like enzyme